MALEICGLFWHLRANEVGPSPGHICHHKACWQQEQLNLIHQWLGGGALSLESGTGMCQSHDPLFSGQSALRSLPIYHQYAAHVPPILIF